MAMNHERRRPSRALRLLSPAALALGVVACAHQGPPKPQAKSELVTAPGLTLSMLEKVAVATFTVEGVLTDSTGAQTLGRKVLMDPMRSTDAFVEELGKAGVSLADRADTDANLAECGSTAADLLNSSSAPACASVSGVKTLVVGYYRFTCQGADKEKFFSNPERVVSQSIRLRGFDLSSTGILFDVEVTLDEAGSLGRLLPRSLARGGGRMLIAKLTKAGEKQLF